MNISINVLKQFLILILLPLLFINTISAQRDRCGKWPDIPGESNKNRFEVDGKRFEYPFTMFNKNDGSWLGVDNAISQIRKKIDQGFTERREPDQSKDKTAALYYACYKRIYSHAKKQIPKHEAVDELNSNEIALWTKHNAFVRLIGLGILNDGSLTVTTLTDVQKSDFVERCISGFDAIYGGNKRECFGNVDRGVRAYYNMIGNRSDELIMWLQAYDLLKAAGISEIDDGNCCARNRLRIFTHMFSKEVIGIYGVITHRYKGKKHYGLKAAAALGMAAVVLNDAGIKRKALHPHWAPEKWGKEAIDGIDDNLFVGKHWWPAHDVPQSARGHLTGYAEGTRGFEDAFCSLIPFFRALSNFSPAGSGTDYLSWNHNAEVMRIMSWADQLQSVYGKMPSIDASFVENTSICAVTGLKEFHTGKLNESTQDYAASLPLYLVADLIASLSEHSVIDASNTPKTILRDAGSVILREADNKRNEHYLHMLFEDAHSIDVEDGHSSNYEEMYDYWSWEDNDFGAFQIMVNDTSLALDPFGDDKYTNKYDDHNIIRFLNSSNEALDEFRAFVSINDFGRNGFALKYATGAVNIGVYPPLSSGGEITRSITSYNTNGSFYWLLNDKIISNNNEVAKIRWQLNGAGSPVNTRYTYNNRESRWMKYCPNWGLFSHSSFLNGDNDLVTPYPKYDNDNNSNNQTISDYEYHTRIEYFQNREKTLVQTVLMPYRCNADSSLPTITRREDNDSFVITTLNFQYPLDTVVEIPGRAKTTQPPVFVNDTITNFHLARMLTGRTFYIANPFNLDAGTAILESDADNIFMSRGQYVFERPGVCAPSIIAFKQAEIINGSTLKYDDTVYIQSGSAGSFQYQYDGKFRYKGYVNSQGGAQVTFLLPDMQQHFEMQGFKNDKIALTTHHDYNNIDSFKYVTIDFPAGMISFTIRLADPCAGDCYFPPTDITIYDLFEFNIGLQKPLDHDLDIVPGGHLRFSNASRMSICPNNVLVNKDSLTMKMGCGEPHPWILDREGPDLRFDPDTLPYICDKDLLLEERVTNEFRNTLIVNDRAALVLDSGSVTHIGNSSTIIIRPGGTLLIKAGATVIIGDSDCPVNRGELLVDHGAFVCVEQGALLTFYNDIDSFNYLFTDTLDRHIVYIAMKNTNGDGAITGTNPSGGRGKFVPLTPNEGSAFNEAVVSWADNNCMEICSWNVLNGPFAVQQRPFGWCNISVPKAYYTSLDTLCIDNDFYIDATKSLNEVAYTITVCKYDTTTQTCITQLVNIAEAGDFCLSKRYVFTPHEFGYYQVQLIVFNDCGLTDTFTKIVYVPYLPVASFTAPDSICPGPGTLHANGSASTSNIYKQWHRWSVEPIYDDSTAIAIMSDTAMQSFESKSWTFTGNTPVDNNFNFPDYNFAGGMRYIISLQVKGWCSDSVLYDTVSVPLKVDIDIDRTKTYLTPNIEQINIGNSLGTNVKLKGTVKGATNWYWTPHYYIDNPDSLNINIAWTESIANEVFGNYELQYYLVATSGACTLKDSITIEQKYTTIAGNDITICKGEPVLLGSDFNLVGLFWIMNMNGFSYGLIPSYQYNWWRSGSSVEAYKDYSRFLMENMNHPNMPWFIKDMWISRPELRQLIHQKIYETPTGSSNLADIYERFFNEEQYSDYETLINLIGGGFEPHYDVLIMIGEILSGNSSGYEYMRDQLENWNNNYYIWRDTSIHNTTIHWYKEVNGQWVIMSDFEDYYNLVVRDSTTTRYKMEKIVFNPYESTYTTLFDEVTVTRDNATLQPTYEVLYQEDSTVYFVNTTYPQNSSYSYTWDFGDGSISTGKNPIHTFAAFGSAYNVCLSITNNCGTYQHCDTVWVDSMGLAYNSFNKTDLNAENEPEYSTVKAEAKPRTNRKLQTENGVQLNNIPNPFNNETTISYLIDKEYSTASLRITDVLGRTINEVNLRYAKGKIPFDAGNQKNGMYYVSLIVDGAVVKSKTMQVLR